MKNESLINRFAIKAFLLGGKVNGFYAILLDSMRYFFRVTISLIALSGDAQVF